MLLRLDSIERRFGARRLFSEVAFEVRRGDRLGLVGPNGAGKTSLLRIASGDEPPDAGRVIRARGVRVGLLRQEIDPRRERSVRDEAATALAHLDALEAELRTMEGQMGEVADGEIPAPLADRYDQVHTRFEFEGGFERGARVERVLGGLGFEEEARGRPLSSFSGGWLMRVELAKLLLAQPDVLLLDEPTNHLDLPSIEWFEGTLQEFRGAVVVISHDRTFLRRHANRVAELARGRFELYEGGFDRFLADRELRREQLEAAKRNQERRIEQQQRFIDRFRYKASKARQVQSRVKALEKIERIEIESDAVRRPRLRIPPPARAGRSVMTLSNLHKAYDEKRVFEGIDLEIERGQRVALVGPNGAGKSTLLRLLAGVLTHEQGERTPGHNVVTAFYAQHQLEALDPLKSVLEELAGVARTDELTRLRSHLGGFLFSGDEVDKKVSVLSGGEKARLALAKLFFHPANFMVLDEPTNHLDMAAREALEQALAGFEGTLVFVSHDRSFINALANRVTEVRAGVLRSFPGNYDDYRRKIEAQAAASTGPAAKAPPAAPKPRMQQREQERQRRKRESQARRRIEALESQIEQHELALGALDARLTDPSVYRDGEQVRSIEADRVQLRAEIERATREWEALTARLD